jgi:hypothetical protein
LATFADGFLTITKAPLKVTANNKSKTCGASNPPLTYTVNGFVNKDTTAVVSGSAVRTTTATAASPVGTYPITCDVSGMSGANYTFTAVAGTLKIWR